MSVNRKILYFFTEQLLIFTESLLKKSLQKSA